MTAIEELVLQFQQKDVKAYEQLYKLYNKSVAGIVFNIVKNEDITQEITQDVFVKAWYKAETYNATKGRFFTWLLNIARNAAIDYTRSKNFNKSQQNQDVDLYVHILESNQNFDSTTNTIGLKEFVKKLNETCKSLIKLLYFEGYTQQEASDELEIPLGTIKTRNRACLNELRLMLKL